MHVLLNSNIERLKFGQQVFRVFLGCLVISILLYGYFVSTSIINVLVRKDIEQGITDVSSRLSELETRYLTLKNDITIEYAYSRGFVEASEKHYAVRGGLPGGLSLNFGEASR